MKLRLDNILLIAGTGRNSGKTSVACTLIQHFSSHFHVMAIKISPHKHSPVGKNQVIKQSSGYSIVEEFEKNTGKDSSRMLNAGASRSFYIEAKDTFVNTAFHELYENLPSNVPIICESPALRAFVNPGVFIITHHAAVIYQKEYIIDQYPLADLMIDISSNDRVNSLDIIHFKEDEWKLES